MAANDLGDAEVAERIATDTVNCDRSAVSRYRRGLRRPDWDVIGRIKIVTDGQVTADDFENLAEAAE